jgi:hypothetical protein
VATAITEGAALYGHRNRAGAARLPAEADGLGRPDRKRFPAGGADMTSTAIELSNRRAVEQAQQSMERAPIVRSDGKSASIKSILECIQPELVMGGLRALWESIQPELVMGGLRALWESIEVTPHHNLPERLARVPKVGEWMPYVPLPLERGSGTPIKPNHQSWCTWMR